MENMKVKNAIVSKQPQESDNFKKFSKIVQEKNINVQAVKAGDKLKIEKNLYFNILWPYLNNQISDNLLNNNSIVCKMVYKNCSVLFTGDIEEIAEREIIKLYQSNLNILNSTVLKVAHHGSKSSSTQEFLKAVNPKIALIGVGKNNLYGHPNYMVLERLDNMRV